MANSVRTVSSDEGPSSSGFVLFALEFLEAVQRTEEMTDNFLPEETEYKPWYNRRPVDEDDTVDQSIIFEVPTINFPSKSSAVLTEDAIKSIHRGISRNLMISLRLI